MIIIVDSLRRFGHRQEVPELTNVKVGSIIDDVTNLCKEKLIVDGINFQTDIAYGLKERLIKSHPIELVQVLVNLLNNSYDAVRDIKEAVIQVKIEEDETAIRFLVIDNGQGIPQGLVEKVMDPFFTTKEIGKGTGIGLNLSKNLMKRMGGELLLESSVSPTTFLVRLPK